MHIIDMMNSNHPKAAREILNKNYRHQKRSVATIQQKSGISKFNDYYDNVNDKFEDEMQYDSSLASENKAESGTLCS